MTDPKTPTLAKDIYLIQAVPGFEKSLVTVFTQNKPDSSVLSRHIVGCRYGQVSNFLWNNKDFPEFLDLPSGLTILNLSKFDIKNVSPMDGKFITIAFGEAKIASTRREYLQFPTLFDETVTVDVPVSNDDYKYAMSVRRLPLTGRVQAPFESGTPRSFNWERLSGLQNF